MLTQITVTKDPEYYDDIFITVCRDRKKISSTEVLSDRELEEAEDILMAALEHVREQKTGRDVCLQQKKNRLRKEAVVSLDQSPTSGR